MIDAADLKVSTWPEDTRRGGQHVGTWPSGVRVEHVPSGIVAIVDIGKSQFTNREIAVDMIAAALTHPRYR